WPVRVAGSNAQPTGGVRESQGVDGLGELAPEALAAWFARAAIYALPARYEPFGQTALEAALSGCALVLGDVPSLREVWGPAAMYVPPDDHEALHAALRRLIAGKSLRERYARRARARALQYAPERMVDAYLAAYREVSAPRQPVDGLPRLSPGLQKETACAS
ncbi:MAG: glycosyltransferase family 1 protein, partial [Comamonadaceae bacterium]